MSRRPKLSGWYEDFRARLRFERSAVETFPGLRATRHGTGGDAVVSYGVTVPLGDYESRTLTIEIADLRSPVLVRVLADGPDESPHRYMGGGLCMWHPDAPDSKKWVPPDG